MQFFDQLSREMNQTLGNAGYRQPTPIQQQTLPITLAKKDILGIAQTGTGKTAAFVIPILESLFADNRKTQAVVLCPTRELAMQTTRVFQNLSAHMRNMRTVCVYGGQPVSLQIRALRAGAQIVVGTPGRLKDLIQRGVLKLKYVRMAVLDEADEMLDIGFRKDMHEILSLLPEDHQTMLFSATMNLEVSRIARQFQRDPVRVEIGGTSGRSLETIAQSYMTLQENEKNTAVRGLLEQHQPRLTLVFCNTRRRVRAVQKSLMEQGFSSACLHGEMRQKERDAIMNAFRRENTKVLVATDVAARGIDIDKIDLVVNYDMPDKLDSYVHRIGRTGRAGKSGAACTLIGARDKHKLREIETRLHIKLKRHSPMNTPVGRAL